MRTSSTGSNGLDVEIQRFYVRCLLTLSEARVPFLVGGGHALAYHTGIIRDTKDFDVFVKAENFERALAALASAGFEVERTFPHWLGKAFAEEGFIDVIFGSGNGVATVDQGWIDHADEAEILGQKVKVCPPEEMIWSKSFVMERERYDGADIAHLMRARGARLDWQRLLRRFGPHWRLLLSYLVLFGFIYPGERSPIPDWLLDEMIRRLKIEQAGPVSNDRVCRGTLLSREQFLHDVGQWGFRDARLAPEGMMSHEAIAQWTAAIYS